MPPPRGLRRATLGVMVPLVIAAIGIWWTAVAAWRTTFATFGRDQGIFQYVAWAIGQGERDYADFREINGPLPHLWHLAFDHLGGFDEHVFRVLDIALSAVVFLIVGALLPGLGRRRGDERPPPTPAARTAWAVAAAVVLMAQYVSFGWWQTAQRESHYDLLLLLSIGLLVHGLRPGPDGRARALLLGLAGALGALTWFGKPTCVVYSAVAATLLVLDRDSPGSWQKRLGAFAVGCAVASAAMLGVIVAIGDLGSYVTIVFGEVPRLYRYIWSRSYAECWTIYGNTLKVTLSTLTLLVALVGYAVFRPPRRALLALSLLACGLFLFFAQRKGFPYHLHPVTAGAHLALLAAAACWTDRVTEPTRARTMAGPLVLAASLGLAAHFEAGGSDAAHDRWDLAGANASMRAEQPYFDHFAWGDFFAWDLRRAAAFLRQSTRPDERVQTYGMDPYLLYLARRKCATPYIYSFELDVDAALAGGSGGRPGDADRAWLLDTARRHEHEMLTLLEIRPPAAFALIDKAPFDYPLDAVADFDRHCPNASAFMHAGYVPAAQFGAVHIWLRRDVAERQPKT